MCPVNWTKLNWNKNSVGKFGLSLPYKILLKSLDLITVNC
jgi:hypothetical protein